MKMQLNTKAGEKDEVLMSFSQEVQEVQEIADLIKSIGCKDFQDRHWEKIADRMESQIGNMDRRDLTLQKLLDEGALEHAEFIGDTAGMAKGEAELSNSMNEVKERWSVREFSVFSYRDSKEYYIIKEVEDVITELEDDIMQVSAMMGSRYVAQIREEVQKWLDKLGYMSDTIDEWLTFQRQWMYLENIFGAEDIQTQLKAETKAFKAVDKFWKEHMQRAKKDPKVVLYEPATQIYKRFQD